MSNVIRLSDLKDAADNKPPKVTVVKLATSYWHDINGVHQKRSIRCLRRKTTSDFNILDEEVSATDAKTAMMSIVNLDQCPDGEYYLVTTNHGYDWETGYVDSYDLKLVPTT